VFVLVGLRAGKFVDLDHEQRGSWKHMKALWPWLSIC